MVRGGVAINMVMIAVLFFPRLVWVDLAVVQAHVSRSARYEFALACRFALCGVYIHTHSTVSPTTAATSSSSSRSSSGVPQIEILRRFVGLFRRILRHFSDSSSWNGSL